MPYYHIPPARIVLEQMEFIGDADGFRYKLCIKGFNVRNKKLVVFFDLVKSILKNKPIKSKEIK